MSRSRRKQHAGPSAIGGARNLLQWRTRHRHKVFREQPGAEAFSMVISPTHSGLRLALHFVQFLFAAVYLLLLSFFTVALLRALFVAPPWLLVGTLLLIAFLWGWMFSVTLPQLHGYAGSERVRLHEGRLEIRRSLFGIRWKAGAAEAREIRGLTVEQPALWLRQPTRLIVVDCKTRRFAFGGGLQYEQGQELAGRLRRALRR